MGLHFGLPAERTDREALSILAGLPCWMSGPGQLPSLFRAGSYGSKK